MRHARTILVGLATLATVVALEAAPAVAAPPSHRTSIGSYVAIGDSYTAGLGIPTWEYDGGCYRSHNNYPSMLATQLDAAEVHDVSCSGATPADTVEAQYAGVPPQFDALSADTDLVTVGLGANQGNLFRWLVLGCSSLRSMDPTGQPCEDTATSSGSDVFYNLADGAGQAVGTVLDGIRQRSPHAQLVVVGYPRLAPSRGTCAALPLAAGDYAYVNDVLERLDLDIRRAAAAAGADYIDMWGISRGHDICSDDPWIQGSVNANGQASPYHPFVAEQAVVAGLIADVVQGSGAASAGPAIAHARLGGL